MSTENAVKHDDIWQRLEQNGVEKLKRQKAELLDLVLLLLVKKQLMASW